MLQLCLKRLFGKEAASALVVSDYKENHEKNIILSGAIVSLSFISSQLPAASALSVLGEDYTFPNKIEEMPVRLSDFSGLEINSFKTSDGAKLAYWEAGNGEPLIFIPGWSANGAEYINVMYLLSRNYHVYVLDPRNQGLSENVDFGMRIARFARDLKELNEHLGIKSASYCGWSMGASILYSYIDIFGTGGIKNLTMPATIGAISSVKESMCRRRFLPENTAPICRVSAGWSLSYPTPCFMFTQKRKRATTSWPSKIRLSSSKT